MHGIERDIHEVLNEHGSYEAAKRVAIALRKAQAEIKRLNTALTDASDSCKSCWSVTGSSQQAARRALREEMVRVRIALLEITNLLDPRA
jgi:Fe-S cluster biogenesis protein NfuA